MTAVIKLHSQYLFHFNDNLTSFQQINSFHQSLNIKFHHFFSHSRAFPQLKGETPFSCCSIRSTYPCIHHGIEVTSDAYLYRKAANLSVSTTGCHTVILGAKISTGWTLVWKTVLLLLLQVEDFVQF